MFILFGSIVTLLLSGLLAYTVWYLSWAPPNGMELSDLEWHGGNTCSNDKLLAPSRGYNSNNAIQWRVSEADLQGVMDAIDSNGLNACGYDLIVLDTPWWKPGELDSHGRFIPDPQLYPIINTTGSLRPLTDLVHSKGYRFGLWVPCCVPVGSTDPLLIALEDTSVASNWDLTYLMWPNVYENNTAAFRTLWRSMFRQWIMEWDIDYIKFDRFYGVYRQIVAEEIWMDAIHQADNERGRKTQICFSSGKKATIEQGNEVFQNYNTPDREVEVRITDDVTDFWFHLNRAAKRSFLYAPWTQGNQFVYADYDMLPLGSGYLRGRVSSHDTSEWLTRNQQALFAALWAINKSPLLVSTRWPLDRYTLAVLKNPILLDMQQHGYNITVYDVGKASIQWNSVDRRNSRRQWVLVSNLNRRKDSVSVDLSGAVMYRDIWTNRTVSINSSNSVLQKDLHPYQSLFIEIILK